MFDVTVIFLAQGMIMGTYCGLQMLKAVHGEAAHIGVLSHIPDHDHKGKHNIISGFTFDFFWGGVLFVFQMHIFLDFFEIKKRCDLIQYQLTNS